MRFKLFFCTLVVILSAVLGAVLSAPKAYAADEAFFPFDNGDYSWSHSNYIKEFTQDYYNGETPCVLEMPFSDDNSSEYLTFVASDDTYFEFVGLYHGSFTLRLYNASDVRFGIYRYDDRVIGSLNPWDGNRDILINTNTDSSSFHCNFIVPFLKNIVYDNSIFPYEFKTVLPLVVDLSGADVSAVSSISNAGLLAELYEITFTPTKIMPSDVSFPLLDKPLAVAPVAVVDDSGYNLISLQVPQLGYYTDVVIFGHYDFTPRNVSKYSFDKLTLSFGVDKLNENDEEYTGDVSNSDFSCTFAGWDLSASTLTVNSFSFLYNTKTQNYSNVELAAFDFITNTAGSYPSGQLNSIGSINIKSAGSFCYNFTFDKVNDVQNKRPLTPEEIDDLSDSGNKRTQRTITQYGYIPRDFSANTVDVDFGDWQPKDYDFSSASGLLSILMNDFIIDIILACVSIGIVGLILYGKQ